jgi:hypothetical protein
VWQDDLWNIGTDWTMANTQPHFDACLFNIIICFDCLLCEEMEIKYTGCPRRNVPDFGRVFLMLKYTDITQNTYVQSLTVTEIMAGEKCGLLAGPRTVPVS